MKGIFILVVIIFISKNIYGDLELYIPDPGTSDDEYNMPTYYSHLENFVNRLNISKNPDDVRFFLYNRLNPNISYELFLNDTQSFHKSPFDPNAETKFIIHGFWTNYTSPMPTTIKKALMESDSTANVLLVQWGLLSTPIPRVFFNKPFSYPVVVTRSIPIVYNRVADFARFMCISNLTDLDKIHIIGHSLGAHIAGSVGRRLSEFPENGGRKPARITALDPAHPLFHNFPLAQKVTMEDANFVDVYYTAAGSMGIPTLTDGHVNFIPNGGHHQPGCVDPMDPFFGGEAEFGGCSHDVVHRIYAASIIGNITACECDLKLAKNMECSVNCTESILVGEKCPTSARGLYYFETDENYYT